MIERQAVIDVIENSQIDWPEAPGHNWVLSVPGIAGHHCAIPSPELNLVGKARLTEDTVDATIAQVQEIFRREGKLFGWLVTPSSQPADLRDHLLQAGFVLAEELAGLALLDLGTEIPANPAVRVERLDIAEMGNVTPMMARAYGLPVEAAQAFTDFFQALGRHMTFWLYLAYLPESDEPVAFANTYFPPDAPIVVLQGAGTLPEHRGRGVYTTLVAHRLRDARESGAQAAVIQANRATSAPIATRLGFEELVPMAIYVWDPASGTWDGRTNA